MTRKKYERIKFMITILRRGQSDIAIKELRRLGVTYNMAAVGYSAVGLDVADYLGLTDSECDLIYSVVPEKKVKNVLSMLEYKFSLSHPHTGIVFCIPISGVSGPLALKYISGVDTSTLEKMTKTDREKEKEKEDEEEEEND